MVKITWDSDEELEIEEIKEIKPHVQESAPHKFYLIQFTKEIEDEDKLDDLLMQKHLAKLKLKKKLYDILSNLAIWKFTNGAQEYRDILTKVGTHSLLVVALEKKNIYVVIFMLAQSLVNTDARFDLNDLAMNMLKAQMKIGNPYAIYVYCLCAAKDYFAADIAFILNAIKNTDDIITKALVAGLITHLKQKNTMLSSEAIEEFWRDYCVTVRAIPQFPAPISVPITGFPAHVTIHSTAQGPETHIHVQDAQIENSRAEPVPSSVQVVKEIHEVEEEESRADPISPPVQIVEETREKESHAEPLVVEQMSETREIEEKSVQPRCKKQKVTQNFAAVEQMFMEWKTLNTFGDRDYERSKYKEMRISDVFQLYKQFAIRKKRADDYYLSANVNMEDKLETLERALETLRGKYVRIETKKLIRRNVEYNIYFTM